MANWRTTIADAVNEIKTNSTATFTFIGDKLNELLTKINAIIDDATASTTSTFSSTKIKDLLSGKVNNSTLGNYYKKTETDAKYEPKITKNTAFNKNFGTTAGTVAKGNDSRFHTHANKSVLDGISAADIAGWGDKYTKSQTDSKIDAAIAGAYKPKPSVATVSALPTTGNAIGDVRNVTSTGMNYVWVGGTDGDLGNGWDSLGGVTDLSAYAKISYVDSKTAAVQSNLDNYKNQTLAAIAIPDWKADMQQQLNF